MAGRAIGNATRRKAGQGPTPRLRQASSCRRPPTEAGAQQKHVGYVLRRHHGDAPADAVDEKSAATAQVDQRGWSR